MHDIAPVAGICRQPNVMVVNPSFPAKTVPEFIAYAKANSGRINMASTGSGTPSHVAGELFRMMTGASMTHVPYRGGAPAVTDLIGGQVQVYFGALASSLELIKSDKLRALAVTSATRLDVLPDIPAVAEFVPGYEARGLFGIGAPRNTPPAPKPRQAPSLSTSAARCSRARQTISASRSQMKSINGPKW
jgi:tripartite-type tricarboxylate transporter receptor subunit TctC